MIQLLLEHQMNLIILGKKNIFIRIHFVLEYKQISKLIMKKINLVRVKKQLIFKNKTQYLKVIIYNLNWKTFYKVVIINLL